MTYRLIKCSSPGWERDFPTLDDAIDELRANICAMCLDGSEWEFAEPVDIKVDGRVVECRDVTTLLSTSCGLEFEIEEHAA